MKIGKQFRQLGGGRTGALVVIAGWLAPANDVVVVALCVVYSERQIIRLMDELLTPFRRDSRARKVGPLASASVVIGAREPEAASFVQTCSLLHLSAINVLLF